VIFGARAAGEDNALLEMDVVRAVYPVERYSTKVVDRVVP